MLVPPHSDHVIPPDADQFRAAVQAATAAAQDGGAVGDIWHQTGPRRNRGYGWLEMSQAPSDDFAPVPQPLKAFVENLTAPPRRRCWTAGGQHLWNAGGDFPILDHRDFEGV